MRGPSTYEFWNAIVFGSTTSGMPLITWREGGATVPVSRKVLMMTGAALATVGVCSIPAAAATIDWTSWNPGFTIGVPFGAASGTAGGVTVSYAGELESLVVGYPSYSPTSTNAGGVVGN